MAGALSQTRKEMAAIVRHVDAPIDHTMVTQFIMREQSYSRAAETASTFIWNVGATGDLCGDPRLSRWGARLAAEPPLRDYIEAPIGVPAWCRARSAGPTTPSFFIRNRSVFG